MFSDTHGCIAPLKSVMNWAKERIPPRDTICCAAFLGDGISDLRRAADETGFYSEWKLIRGNNDYNVSVPDSAVFDFAENRFYMCHGHRHNLYSGYHSLLSSARSSKADVVLFGHTHTPFLKKTGGIFLVNPGSVGRPRSKHGASFAVIECVLGKQPKVEFWGISSHGEVFQINVS